MERSKLTHSVDDALSIFVHSALSVIELNSTGVIVNANDKFLSLAGYSTEELVGQPGDLLYPSSYRTSPDFRELKQAWHDGRRVSGLYPQKHKSGRIFWLETEFNPILDSDGKAAGSLGISTDATEKMEKNVKQDTFHQTLMVVECAPDGRILKANDLYLSTLKYKESEVLGRNHNLHFDPTQTEAEQNRQVWDYILDGNSYTQKMRWLNSEGQSIWVEATYSPVFDENKSLVKILLLAQDVTWRVNQELKDQLVVRRLARVCDDNDNPILLLDQFGETLYINERFSTVFGYSQWDIKDGRAGIVFGPAAREVMPKIFEVLKKPGGCQLIELVYDKHGRRFWVNCSVSHVTVDNETDFLALTFTDLTGLKMKELIQNKALEAMCHDRPITDVFNSMCREVEKIMPEVTVCVIGLDEQKRLKPLAYPSLPTTCALVLTGSTPGKACPASGQAIREGKPALVEDISTSEGTSQYIRASFVSAGLISSWAVPIISSTNEIFGTVSFYFKKPTRPDYFHKQLGQVMVRICAVILERDRTQKSIQRLALYDDLTGLPNRGYFLCSADRMLAAAKRNGTYVTFILMSLNRFKELNAKLGHGQSEEMLLRLTQRLQEHCYKPTEFLGRIADDVLGLVLAETHPLKSGAAALEINQIISQPLKIGTVTLNPSVSQGISVYPADGQDIDTLMHKASLAMRKAKSLGYGQFVFSTSEQDELAKEAMAMETALRQAIGSSELRLHYQPQISLEDGRIFGAEALIRWQSPVFGNVSPGRFIGITENSGLINPLSAWVVEESCRQLGQWRHSGLEVPALSINVSSTNFKDPTFFANLSQCMDENDLFPNDLILELNESVYIDSDCRTINGIDKAYESGLRLSVDDFGTGYSCLSYLHRLPISEIKLDQSFVADFQDSDVSRRISQAIKGIGQSLGLNLVAEGVETREQLEVLKEQGWHAVQGFLYSPALPGQEFEDWLANYLKNGQTIGEAQTKGPEAKKKSGQAVAARPMKDLAAAPERPAGN